MLYGIFLALHSIIRWVVIIFALVTIIRAFIGWFGNRPWTALENRLGMLFSLSFDIQILLGAILYFFLSPLTTQAMQNFGGAMKNTVFRFFTVEHLALMVIAGVIIHVGRAVSKKATNDQGKFKRAAIFYTIAILLVLVAIPWPFFSYGRPLIRL